ncbi:MAG: V-type ATPase subunit [Thermoplasmata archaeon]|nr:V-type ATPase subunit [Thermoplasmata archaeon]
MMPDIRALGLIGPEAGMAAFDVTNPLAISFAIIGIVLLVVIILFLSYFTILRAIAAYSYSNARFKAMGTHFLSGEALEGLSESTSLSDMASRLAELDFRVPQTPRLSIEELEETLEAETIRMLRNTLAATPDGAKPFFRAYLIRMDALQIKAVLRSLRSGQEPVIHPSYYVDAEKMRLLTDASSPQDVAEIMGDNMLGIALSNGLQQHPEEPVAWELFLNRAVLDNMNSSVSMVDDEIRGPIREFYGRLADITNIKLLARAGSLGAEGEHLTTLLAPGGRELPGWMLERLIEIKDMAGLLSELDTTSYGRYMKKKGLRVSNPSELERAMESYMLDVVCEISSKNTLLAGPALKFAYGKEREIKNITAVARGVLDRLSFQEIEPFLIMEGTA